MSFLQFKFEGTRTTHTGQVEKMEVLISQAVQQREKISFGNVYTFVKWALINDNCLSHRISFRVGDQKFIGRSIEPSLFVLRL